MLEHLGFKNAHDRIIKSIEETIKSGNFLTPDMGGKSTTEQLGKAIALAL